MLMHLDEVDGKQQQCHHKRSVNDSTYNICKETKSPKKQKDNCNRK